MTQRPFDAPVVSSCLIERGDGSVLICRRGSSNEDAERVWELPATLNRTGESPEAAARRGGKEGLGLIVTVVIGQPPFQAVYQGRPASYRVFVCTLEAGEAKSTPPYAEVRWVHRGQLCEYDFQEPNRKIIGWYTQ